MVSGRFSPSNAEARHPTEHGALPGHVACAAGNADALRALLDCGAPPRSRDGVRQSLLHYAVRSGNVSRDDSGWI